MAQLPMHPSTKVTNAILSIRPKSQFGVGTTYESLDWMDDSQVKPTEEEFNDVVTAWNAEYDAQEYARNRRWEYPEWDIQLNKIYDDGVTKWKAEMVDPVKVKWPKDNSGPV